MIRSLAGICQSSASFTLYEKESDREREGEDQAAMN